MRLSLRPSRDLADVLDEAGKQRARQERQVRHARLEVARREPTWTEIPAARLVDRGRFLVDSETDLLYVRYRGHVWQAGRATVGYLIPGARMTFYVVDELVVFVQEPGAGPRTWSELIERRPELALP